MLNGYPPEYAFVYNIGYGYKNIKNQEKNYLKYLNSTIREKFTFLKQIRLQETVDVLLKCIYQVKLQN